jgi:hypothetical protein
MSQTYYAVVKKSELLKLVFCELVKEIYCNLFRREKRDKVSVSGDYDLGSWKEILLEQRWENSNNLLDFLLPAKQKNIIARIDNSILKISNRQYYIKRIDLMNKELLACFDQNVEFVELGSGFGWNIFALHSTGIWKKLTGLEISKNGLSISNSVVEKFHLNNIKFMPIDLTDSNDPNYKSLEGKNIFTHFCFEQLKYNLEEIIENLVKNKVKRVVNIESSAGSINLASPLDWITYLYIKRKDYQMSLKEILNKLEAEGKIRIINNKRLYYAPSIKNDAELFCWEPVAN